MSLGTIAAIIGSTLLATDEQRRARKAQQAAYRRQEEAAIEEQKRIQEPAALKRALKKKEAPRIILGAMKRKPVTGATRSPVAGSVKKRVNTNEFGAPGASRRVGL